MARLWLKGVPEPIDVSAGEAQEIKKQKESAKPNDKISVGGSIYEVSMIKGITADSPLPVYEEKVSVRLDCPFCGYPRYWPHSNDIPQGIRIVDHCRKCNTNLSYGTDGILKLAKASL